LKHKVFSSSETTGIKVSDQYPKVIQERRTKLIPELIKSKNQSKYGVLVYDKLYID
jgi:hypothetical protein